MAVRKDVTETLVVKGAVDDWMPRIGVAFTRAGFKKVVSSPALRQVTGRYRNATTSGALTVTAQPEGPDTRLTLTATAAVDNVYALFRSPSQRILTDFKAVLSAL